MQKHSSIAVIHIRAGDGFFKAQAIGGGEDVIDVMGALLQRAGRSDGLLGFHVQLREL